MAVAYIDGPAGGPYIICKVYVFVKNKHTHLTVPPRILHRYCVISLSYHKQTSMMGQEKKLGFFYITCALSSLPLALDNVYIYMRSALLAAFGI